ncbi:MAG: aldo/keto reductase [Bacteroidota bacterium]|nr:aldo/keto reductase [Bacteroidota bacterium]
MDFISLGKSPLKISRIGFGCMSLPNDQQMVNSLTAAALDAGINFFDTADLYGGGSNETMLGSALRDKRKSIVLATKVGNQLNADGKTWTWNAQRSYILSAVENSLRRLHTDYIDLYQLHGGTMNDPIDETIDAFETLRKQGKIRCYGISSIRPSVIRAWSARSSIVSVMMQYSLLDRRPEESALDFLHDKNIGVLARGALASGLLINKPAHPYLNRDTAVVEKAADAIRRVSGPDRSPVASSLRFALCHPAISAAVVGVRSLEQLKVVTDCFRSPELTAGELQQVRKAVPPHYYAEHR